VPRYKVAVVGGGIAGLAAAWRLSSRHEVTLFERHASPGMAVHGVQIGSGVDACRVDVPLRVFYPGYYPQLTALYRDIGVETEVVDYSATFTDADRIPFFGYRNWHLGPLAIPFPERGSILGLRALRIVRDLVRLRRRRAGGTRGRTIGALLEDEGYSHDFSHGFLLPTFATICTCTYASVSAFPAEHVIDYLRRGVLLTSVRRARAGADDVVRRLTARIAHVRCSVDLEGVTRSSAHVDVRVDGTNEPFDHVVVATQANQALRLLDAPTEGERRALSAFRYESVEVVMHTDRTLLPARREAWAPVNLLVSAGSDRPMSTIWMNAVQPALRGRPDVFQTVHPLLVLDAEKVLATARFERSVVDAASDTALDEISHLHDESDRRVWFCGSYARAGIPLLESAVASSARVVEALSS
jgi:predicted NAD/FAD-binding protein